MFGFLGQGVAKVDLTMNGARDGSGSGVRRNELPLSAQRFTISGTIDGDVDNQDMLGDSPTIQRLTALDVPYDPANDRIKFNSLKPTFLTVTGAGGIVTKQSELVRFQRGIGYTYSKLDNNPLVPPTRRLNYLLNNPGDIAFVSLGSTSNIVSATHNKANTFRDDVWRLNHFYNLERATIYEIFQNTLRIDFPENLKHLVLRPSCQTLQGKLPKKLISLSVFWANSILQNIPSDFFDDCNVQSFWWWFCANNTQFPFPTTLTNVVLGSFDISHMSNMKEFCFGGNSVLTSMTLPVGKTDWEQFIVEQTTDAISQTIITPILEDILDSPALQTLIIKNCRYVVTRNLLDGDFSLNLRYIWLYQNSWAGNISLTTPRPTLREFRTGIIFLRGTTGQLNDHPVVNITGATNALVIDVAGSNIQDLQLPVNTVCTQLQIFSNKLDIVTNPNLISQINAITALVICNFGLYNTNPSSSLYGQDSVNGLGANVDISGLVNLTNMQISYCKITSSITLPNVNKLLDFRVSDELFSTVLNLTSHAGLQTQYFTRCPNFDVPMNHLTSVVNFVSRSTGITHGNLSNRVSTAFITTVIIDNNPSLLLITLPAGVDTFRTSGNVGCNFGNNPLLADIVNLSNWKVVPSAPTNIHGFVANNCSLNITFPFGLDSCIATQININNNGMSVANVDGTINNIYTNRAKWNYYSSSKTMNIAGTNAAPSGIYQAPAGFVLGVSDGTPASAKEQLYVLVNNYSWTMTFN